jgi:hypothetical protein
MKNYLIENRETGLIVANGLAESSRDARAKTGYTSRQYTVFEATAPGIIYQPIRSAVSIAAAAMGRKGGSSKSKAKADAAKANGKKGGRPRKHATSNPRKTTAETPCNP